MTSSKVLELISNIQAKTTFAAQLVNSNKIEQCGEILKDRQQLIEQLISAFEANYTDNQPLQDDIIHLLSWIQEQDSPVMCKLAQQQEVVKSQFIKQTHTKKALKAYTHNQ